MKKYFLIFSVLAAVSFVFSFNAEAALLFSDDFNSGAKSVWGNEAGSWYTNGGTYDALYPNNSPLTYSSVTSLPSLIDFTLELNINDVRDGGVWLRSPGTGLGVLLVTHGATNTLYWHLVDGTNDWTAYNRQGYAGLDGSDIALKVKVIGNTYEAFVDGASTPLTTLTTNAFTSGKVGLYDFSGQTFDNVSISDFNQTAVPEPATIVIFGIGGLATAFLKRRKKIS
jgi:hypothetical protein